MTQRQGLDSRSPRQLLQNIGSPIYSHSLRLCKECYKHFKNIVISSKWYKHLHRHIKCQHKHLALALILATLCYLTLALALVSVLDVGQWTQEGLVNSHLLMLIPSLC